MDKKAHGVVTFNIQSGETHRIDHGVVSFYIQSTETRHIAQGVDSFQIQSRWTRPKSQWCSQLSHLVHRDTPHSPWCGQLSDLVQMDMAKKTMVWSAVTFSPDGHGQKAHGVDSFHIQSRLLLGIGLLHTVASTKKSTFLDKQIHPNMKKKKKKKKKKEREKKREKKERLKRSFHIFNCNKTKANRFVYKDLQVLFRNYQKTLYKMIVCTNIYILIIRSHNSLLSFPPSPLPHYPYLYAICLTAPYSIIISLYSHCYISRFLQY